jgi:hypothetical protein
MVRMSYGAIRCTVYCVVRRSQNKNMKIQKKIKSWKLKYADLTVSESNGKVNNKLYNCDKPNN